MHAVFHISVQAVRVTLTLRQTDLVKNLGGLALAQPLPRRFKSRLVFNGRHTFGEFQLPVTCNISSFYIRSKRPMHSFRVGALFRSISPDYKLWDPLRTWLRGYGRFHDSSAKQTNMPPFLMTGPWRPPLM